MGRKTDTLFQGANQRAAGLRLVRRPPDGDHLGRAIGQKRCIGRIHGQNILFVTVPRQFNSYSDNSFDWSTFRRIGRGYDP